MHVRRGYSLLEMMVVIAIIGVFVGFAVPSYVNHLVKTRVGTAFKVMQHYAELGKEYYEANGRFGDAQALGLTVGAQPYLVANPTTINEYTTTQIIDTDATDLCYNNIRFTFNGTSIGASQNFDIQMVVRNVDGLYQISCGIPWNETATSYAAVLDYFPEACTDQNVSTCTE